VKLNERIGRMSVRSTAISNAVCRPVEGVGGKQSSQRCAVKTFCLTVNCRLIRRA